MYYISGPIWSDPFVIDRGGSRIDRQIIVRDR